ncbi:DUF440 family protein [Prosthecobacter sp.]|uniref:DUF440 family protein n=1 Tax=Prosthecobacter sp. TaxID=1965333 RepID=UPI003783B883
MFVLQFGSGTLAAEGEKHSAKHMSTSVPHQYKRRTMDEALDLAKAAFRSVVADHLSPEEIEEVRAHSSVGSGSVRDDDEDEWTKILGARPDKKAWYGIEIYQRSHKCPYVEKVFVRMLVPRDRSTTTVHFIWRPVVPPYTGPYFE